MTSGQKIAFSALISIVLFAGFTIVTRTGFISSIQTRYYAQSKIEQKEKTIENVSKSLDSYITNILSRLEKNEDAYLKTASISSYLSQNPAESDTVERRNLTEQLFYDFPALKGIRFIDKNGINLHFSTYDRTDVAKHIGIKKQYKNYPDIQKEYNEIDVRLIFSENHIPEEKVFFDRTHNRFMICEPVYWLENVYAGCFLFYFDVAQLESDLINKNIISFSDNLEIVSNKNNYEGGFVLGIPADSKDEFNEPVLNFWLNSKKDKKSDEKSVSGSGFGSENAVLPRTEKVLSSDDGKTWIAVDSSVRSCVNVLGVYTSDNFELSREIIYLIYISIFISVFLIVFLIFSLKRDSFLVLKKRIKKLQYGIISEYLKNQENVEWENVANELKARNAEITKQIKRGLGKKYKGGDEELDAILEKSWNEIIDVVTHYSKIDRSGSESSSPKVVGGASIEEIRNVMEELLRTTTVKVTAENAGSSLNFHVQTPKTVTSVAVPVSAPVPTAIPTPAVPEELEEVEEIEEIEEIEEVQELEEVEEIEEIEEVQELEEVEEIEEIEEVQELEEVEEIEEIEEVQELEEVEELEDIEEGINLNPDAAPDPSRLGKRVSDVYIVSEEFATVENMFLEELMLGPEVSMEKIYTDKVFKAFDIVFDGEDFTPVIELEAVAPAGQNASGELEESLKSDEIEELEELKDYTDYTMVKFGFDIGKVSELQEYKKDEPVEPKQTIIETQGVYSISQNLEYGNIPVNKDFKTLVDDVLKQK